MARVRLRAAEERVGVPHWHCGSAWICSLKKRGGIKERTGPGVRARAGLPARRLDSECPGPSLSVHIELVSVFLDRQLCRLLPLF